jgi:hypothetical protein
MEGELLAEMFLLRMETIARLSRDLTATTTRFVPVDPATPPRFKSAKRAPER